MYLYASLWVYSSCIQVPKKVESGFQFPYELELPTDVDVWREFCELKSHTLERQKVTLAYGLSLQSPKYLHMFFKSLNWLYLINFWNWLICQGSLWVWVLHFSLEINTMCDTKCCYYLKILFNVKIKDNFLKSAITFPWAMPLLLAFKNISKPWNSILDQYFFLKKKFHPKRQDETLT